MKKIGSLIGLVALSFSLVSCGDDIARIVEATPVYSVDQKLRSTIFQECLALVPKGPSKTVYNDWSEVVEECGSQAYYQSLVCTANCQRSTIISRDK